MHRLFSRFYGGSGTIVTLHRVLPEPDFKSALPATRTSIITPEYLSALLSMFRSRGYSFIPIGDIPEALLGGGNKFVCISFDDGYRDILRYACPVLKREGVPYTIYITPGFTDRSVFIWWEVISEILMSKKTLILNDKHRTVAYEITARNRNALFNLARSIILRYSKHDLDRYEHTIADYYAIDTRTHNEKLILDWNELLECSRDPLCTIGAHSMNHLAMKHLSADEVSREINESRATIEKKLGAKVDHFAFPYGGPDTVTARDIDIARAEGFTTVCTTRRANIFPAHRSHLHTLPRIHIAGGDKMNIVRQKLWLSGMLPAMKYKGKRVVTV